MYFPTQFQSKKVGGGAARNRTHYLTYFPAPKKTEKKNYFFNQSMEIMLFIALQT